MSLEKGGESRWKYQVLTAKQCAWPCQKVSALLGAGGERGGEGSKPKPALIWELKH